MRRSRSVRAVLTAVATMSVLAACSAGGGSGDGDNGGQKQGEPSTFVIYSSDPAHADAIQKSLQDQFGDPNNATIKMVTYPVDKFLAQFQNAVRSNAEVDGLLINGQNVGFLQANGLLSPIDDLVEESELQPAAVKPFVVDDKLWGAGVGTLNTSMLAYNNDIMEKYDLVVPETFDDIKANVEKLKGSGISMIGFGGATVFQWPMWYMEMLQQTSGDRPIELTRETLSGDGPDFTSEPYVNAMRQLQKLGASGAFPSGLMGAANTAAQADFLAGKTAMYWYGSWVISQFLDQADFDVRIAQFPQFVSGVDPRPVGGVTGAVALYRKVPKEDVDLARKFVEFMTSAEGDELMIKLQPQGFTFPTHTGVEVGDQTEVEKKVVTEFIPQTFGFLDWLWPSAVTTTFQQNIQAVVGQQKSPEDAMAEVQKAFESTK